MEPATKIIRAGSSTLVAAKLQSFCLLSTRESSCCPLREFPSWIEISVENRPVFMKTGKQGTDFTGLSKIDWLNLKISKI
jgi:hypothetical protein